MTIADASLAHASAPGIEQILLDSKIRARAPRDGAVSRHAQIEAARASRRRVVAITAPAGYGKSTLQAEWASSEKRAVGWAAVDRFDDDPGALLFLLATATQHFTPDGAAIAAKMRGTSTTILARSAPLLARAWRSAPAPFVLFIDDFHLASSPDCLDAFMVALQGVPDGSQVVIASREHQSYLARVRLEHDVHDLGVIDLQMDHADAAQIFTHENGSAPRDVVSAAVELSEGWPAGIFLATLAPADASAPAVSGSSGPVADYLYQECLAGLPATLQNFLIDTAILDELSAELCDFVRDRTDSSEMLHSVLSRGLFLTPIDSRQQWYRYHALFKEFLLREGERRDNQRVRSSHLRAADWFEAHRVPRQSVEHLIAGGDSMRAVNSAARISLMMFQRGEASTLERWRSTLGEAVVLSCPPMAVMSAWKSAMFGESPAAEERAAALERIDATLIPQPGRASFEAGRALVRASLCANGADDMLFNAEFAVEQAPPGTPWHGPALYLRAEARLLNGDRPSAERDFREAVLTSSAFGNTTALLLSSANLTILAADRGEWERAAEYAAESLSALEAASFEGYPLIVLALASAARVAAHKGDDNASVLVSRAMRARVQSTHTFPHVAIRARLQLALTFRLLGDEDAAMQLAREGIFLMRRRPRMGALNREIEDFVNVQRTAQPSASSAIVLTPAEMRLLPYLQTHLTLEEIGLRLFLSRATISSQASSIYRKLSARRRGDAVAVARRLGLLS